MVCSNFISMTSTLHSDIQSLLTLYNLKEENPQVFAVCQILCMSHGQGSDPAISTTKRGIISPSFEHL